MRYRLSGVSVGSTIFDGGAVMNVSELRRLIKRLEKTFDGDSNDAEHDAAIELVTYLNDWIEQLANNK